MAAKTTTTTKGTKALANATKQEELDDLYDQTVEVRHADGSLTTLAEGTIPKSARGRAVPKSESAAKPSGKKAPVAPAPRAGKAAAAVAARVKAESDIARMKKEAAAEIKRTLAEAKKKGQEQAKAVRDKALAEAKAKKDAEKAELAKKKSEAAALKKAQQEEAAAKKKADREALAQQKAEEREEARQLRLAAKQRAKGETGDPVADQAFHAAIDATKALAVQPVSPDAFGLTFLTKRGVKLTTVSLQLPDDYSLLDWSTTIRGLTGVGDFLGGFALGDALLFGQAKYGKAQYQVAMDALGLAPSTVKNAATVARLFPPEDRVPGASPYKHLYAANLYRRNPAVALDILREAVADGRTDLWVKQRVQEINAGDGRPTTAAQQAKVKRDALVLASAAQREADYAALGNDPIALAKAVREDTNALLEYASENIEVRSEPVVRVVGRLQGQIDDAQGELQIWKERALRAEQMLAELGHPVNVGTTNQVSTTSLADIITDLDGLDDLDGDDDTEGVDDGDTDN